MVDPTASLLVHLKSQRLLTSVGVYRIDLFFAYTNCRFLRRFSIFPMAGTPLTDREWATMTNNWPDMDGFRAQCLKTGPATPPPGIEYNCIAWVANFTGLWINPPPQRANFAEIREFCGSIFKWELVSYLYCLF